jgi:hypothetical protein
MVFPSQLFNSTLEENQDEIKRWFSSRFTKLREAGNRLPAGFWDSWPGFITFTLLSALLYGLLSPHFGFNNESLTGFIGVAIGLGIVVLLFGAPVRRYFTRTYSDKGHIHVVPATLAIAVGCVAISRFSGFQPGYVYGLLAGYAFNRSIGDDEEARVLHSASVWLLGFAIGAWVLRAPIDAIAEKGDAGPALLILDSVLAAIFVAAVEGLVFALIPLRFLVGEKIYSWQRRRWLILIAAGTFLFVHVLLDPHSGYLVSTDSTSLTTTIWLFGGFAGASVLFWAYFRTRSRSHEVSRP